MTEEIIESNSTETTGEALPPADAAQDTEQKTPEERFEDLISGEYKEQFHKRVQGIINARFKTERKEEQIEADKKRMALSRAVYDSLKNEAEELKGLYPEFDLKAELSNPLFKNLLRSPEVDMRSAYEVCHRDEIISSAMASAAERAKEKTLEGFLSSGSRPSDTVGDSGVAKIDVKALTRKERADLLKRAVNGERITFN